MACPGPHRYPKLKQFPGPEYVLSLVMNFPVVRRCIVIIDETSSALIPSFRMYGQDVQYMFTFLSQWPPATTFLRLLRSPYFRLLFPSHCSVLVLHIKDIDLSHHDSIGGCSSSVMASLESHVLRYNWAAARQPALTEGQSATRRPFLFSLDFHGSAATTFLMSGDSSCIK